MSREFFIEILTPERSFYTGNIQSITLESISGRMTIMAGHTPMVSALSVGQIRIQTEKETLVAFHSKGFVDVTRDFVVVLCQTCEWPDEIDAERARAAAERASKKLTESNRAPDEIGRSKLALLRALSRIRTKEHRE